MGITDKLQNHLSDKGGQNITNVTYCLSHCHFCSGSCNCVTLRVGRNMYHIRENFILQLRANRLELVLCLVAARFLSLLLTWTGPGPGITSEDMQKPHVKIVHDYCYCVLIAVLGSMTQNTFTLMVELYIDDWIQLSVGCNCLLDAIVSWMQLSWMQLSVGCTRLGCNCLLDAIVCWMHSSVGCTRLGCNCLLDALVCWMQLSVGCTRLLDALVLDAIVCWMHSSVGCNCLLDALVCWMQLSVGCTLLLDAVYIFILCWMCYSVP